MSELTLKDEVGLVRSNLYLAEAEGSVVRIFPSPKNAAAGAAQAQEDGEGRNRATSTVSALPAPPPRVHPPPLQRLKPSGMHYFVQEACEPNVERRVSTEQGFVPVPPGSKSQGRPGPRAYERYTKQKNRSGLTFYEMYVIGEHELSRPPPIPLPANFILEHIPRGRRRPEIQEDENSGNLERNEPPNFGPVPDQNSSSGLFYSAVNNSGLSRNHSPRDGGWLVAIDEKIRSNADNDDALRPVALPIQEDNSDGREDVHPGNLSCIDRNMRWLAQDGDGSDKLKRKRDSEGEGASPEDGTNALRPRQNLGPPTKDSSAGLDVIAAAAALMGANRGPR